MLLICKYIFTDPERFYCPYQGCDISRTDRTGVYCHIRERHDLEFPHLNGTSCRVNVLKTPSGKIMNFSGKLKGK